MLQSDAHSSITLEISVLVPEPAPPPTSAARVPLPWGLVLLASCLPAQSHPKWVLHWGSSFLCVTHRLHLFQALTQQTLAEYQLGVRHHAGCWEIQL